MEQTWTTVIRPKNKLFDLKLKELWQYRDLIVMFVKRDFKTMYKQTILGPLWIIINPILTTLMQVLVFGNIADISTDGMPQFLFYMAGNTMWLYFSSCLTKTSTTFTANAAVFGKVYFPRLVTPISIVISGLISFGVQFAIFLVTDIYYTVNGMVHPGLLVLITPLLVIELALLGMGCGIIISALTTKYRDLAVLVTFGVQLWMYGSAIIFPVSSLPEKWAHLLMLNPVVPIVEAFRYAYTGHGTFSVKYLGISAIVTLVILFVGIVIFNKVEKTFMDTV
ncbi:ABC transporter permease [Lachnospiraceae bacterium HCP28S3_F9]